MNLKRYGSSHSPTILIVQSNFEKIEFDSFIFSLFNIVYLYKSENISTLSWIQQNQPDLIVLELEQPENSCESLITPIRLDWLTRDIPVVATGNKFVLQSISNLDYNTSINTPYSARHLYKIICSLINIPSCQTSAS